MFRRLALPGLMMAFLAGCTEGSKPESERLQRVAPVVPQPTLYERLGGKSAITRVVDDFIVLVLADPKIKDEHKEHFKDEARVGELKKKLVDQIGQATGGPEKYAGKNMKDAHKGMKISDDDFNALAADLEKALDQNKVGPTEKKELLDMLEGMRKDVVEKPEE